MFLCCFSITLIAITSAILDVNIVTPDPRSRCPQTLPRNTYLLSYINESVCIQLNHDEHSWNVSRSLCQRYGGDLVVIQNQLKQTFIENAFKQTHWDRKGIWIGGTDLDKEGDWKWVTGERMTWGNWDRGEGPSHSGFLFSKASWEDCAMIRRDMGNKWHDYPCAGIGTSYSSICEYKMVPTTTRALATNNFFTTRTAQTPTTIKVSSTKLAWNTTPSQSTFLLTKTFPTSKFQTSTTRQPVTFSPTPITTLGPTSATTQTAVLKTTSSQTKTNIKPTTSTSPTKTTVKPTSKSAALTTVKLTTKAASTTKATTAKLGTSSLVMTTSKPRTMSNATTNKPSTSSTTYKKPQSIVTTTNYSPTSKPSSKSVTSGTKSTQIATRKLATANPKDTSNSPGTQNKLGQRNVKPLKETSYTGYIIGAAVGAVVVAGILVTIIVIKRKRNANAVSNRDGFTGDNPTYDIMFGKDPSLYADVETNEIYVPNNIKLVFGESCS